MIDLMSNAPYSWYKHTNQLAQLYDIMINVRRGTMTLNQSRHGAWLSDQFSVASCDNLGCSGTVLTRNTLQASILTTVLRNTHSQSICTLPRMFQFSWAQMLFSISKAYLMSIPRNSTLFILQSATLASLVKTANHLVPSAGPELRVTTWLASARMDVRPDGKETYVMLVRR